MDWVDKAIELKKKGVSWTKLPEELQKITGEYYNKEQIRGHLRRKMPRETKNMTELHGSIIGILGNGMTIEEISDRVDRGVGKVKKAIEEMRDLGYDIVETDGKYVLEKEPVAENKVHKVDLSGDTFKFGLCGDTQLCSKYQQLTLLNDYYDRCVEFGANTVFHTGDLIDGENVYKGHKYEIFRVGSDEQVQYAVENYPRRKGIETKFITGNHDLIYYKNQGQDVGRAIAAERDDLIYLGQIGAYVDIIPGVSLYLLHPQGGAAYAHSYKPQKIAAGFSGGEKPKIMALGHWHQGLTMFERNIHIILTMSFQSQTPFLKRGGLMPKIGGYLCEAKVEKGDVRELTTTMVAYYKPIENDY